MSRKKRARLTLQQKRDTRSAYLMLSPFLLLFIVFSLVPIAENVWYSFTNYRFAPGYRFVGLDNYIAMFKDAIFVKSLVNTLIYTLFSVAILGVLGFFAALCLNRRSRTARLAQVFFVIPYATSMVAVSMIWLLLFDPTNGPINKLLLSMGLSATKWLFDADLALPCLIFVNIWKNTGYVMILYLAGLSSINPALYEAATVDGASDFAKMRSITLPLIRPISFFVLTVNLIDSFKTFEIVQVMTRGDPTNSTTTIVHQIYRRAFFDYRGGYASAMSVFLLAVILVITLVNFRLRSRDGLEL